MIEIECKILADPENIKLNIDPKMKIFVTSNVIRWNGVYNRIANNIYGVILANYNRFLKKIKK